MIRIQQMKLRTAHTRAELGEKIRKMLRLSPGQEFSYRIVRRSLDARRKPELFYVYTVDVAVKGEKTLLRRNRDRNIQQAGERSYRFPEPGEE